MFPETPDYQLVMAEIERFLSQMRIRLASIRFHLNLLEHRYTMICQQDVI